MAKQQKNFNKIHRKGRKVTKPVVDQPLVHKMNYQGDRNRAPAQQPG